MAGVDRGLYPFAPYWAPIRFGADTKIGTLS
jgi:hypothetical protein